MVRIADPLDLRLTVVRELGEALKELIPPAILASILDRGDELIEVLVVGRRENNLAEVRIVPDQRSSPTYLPAAPDGPIRSEGRAPPAWSFPMYFLEL